MSGLCIEILNKRYTLPGHEYPSQTIANFRLQIPTNQFVCLVGPSGCGKTTLLNIVARLDQDYQGTILIDSADSLPSIGYVFQNPRLLPWYTVRRNIEVVFPETPPSALIDGLLTEMQLLDVQHQFPQRLSLGMQRRVAIIRAFAINPDILLLDEPFVSLDAPTARQVRLLLSALWCQRPHTVLFVTHDLREAISLADRLVFLSASPMRVVDDIMVEIDRNQRDDEVLVERFRERLLSEYPLVRGLL